MDRHQELDHGVFDSDRTGSEPAYADPSRGGRALGEPDSDRASAIWRFACHLSHQKWFPFDSKLDELFDSIETASPSVSPSRARAVDPPSRPEDVLLPTDIPDDDLPQLDLMVHDLDAYVGSLRQELSRRRNALDHVHEKCTAWELCLNDLRAESSSKLGAEVRNELRIALQILDGRLLRPPGEVLQYLDRARLAKRTRRYAWARWDVCNEIKRIRQSLVIVSETLCAKGFGAIGVRGQYSGEFARRTAELVSAGAQILDFYGVNLRQLQADLSKQRGKEEQLPLPDYVFRKKGKSWNIRYAGGNPFSLPDVAGLFYIVYLLERPSERIAVEKLRQMYLAPKVDLDSRTLRGGQAGIKGSHWG